jgi:glyoxylase-like metal-dependent hydrolase (beta-lactamase superfamily II)
MAASLEPLSDGVFAWVHDVRDRFTCNVGVVVGDDALTVVDSSGVPSSYYALVAALRRFRRPVERLILTHAHGDHVAGAAALVPPEIVASRACAESLAGPPLVSALEALHPTIAGEVSGLTHPTPTRLLDGGAKLDARVRVELLGGHSKGDLVVRVDDADVVFAGDLCFFGHVPLGIGADFPTWAASLATLRGVAGRVVPGHGPIGGRAELEIVETYLAAVLEAAASGAPIAEGPWSAWWDPWGDRIPGASHRINVEQARAPAGLPPTLLALMQAGARA